MHSKAYIFRQQQLLVVDDNFQLPQVKRLQHDLDLSADGEVVARDLKKMTQHLMFVPKQLASP